MMWLVEKCVNAVVQGIKEKDAFLVGTGIVCGIFYLIPVIAFIGTMCWITSKLGGII